MQKTKRSLIKVQEPVPGDWKMLDSSFEHEKVDAFTVQWLIKVPAEQRVTLNYEVLIRY